MELKNQNQKRAFPKLQKQKHVFLKVYYAKVNEVIYWKLYMC